MRVNVKNVIEIASGLVIGMLASEAVDRVGKRTKKVIVNLKEKRESKRA